MEITTTIRDSLCPVARTGTEQVKEVVVIKLPYPNYYFQH